MFNPKTEKIAKLAKIFPEKITELEDIFSGQTNVYIDYANIKPWSNKLGWHIDLKRLKQLLDSFNTISVANFYHGTLIGDPESEKLMANLQSFGYQVKTKPVKKMYLSIDVSNIPDNSPSILSDFIRKPLLQKLRIEVIEFLNSQLKDLNSQGILLVEDFKCNFDVEIGRDIMVDYASNNVDIFVLWSGDSDFADPISQLLIDGKKVFLFATARRVSSELNSLQGTGLFIFDIQKIREFICWQKEAATDLSNITL